MNSDITEARDLWRLIDSIQKTQAFVSPEVEKTIVDIQRRYCPNPSRNGFHEMYGDKDGSVCRACGYRRMKE